ncbi:nitrate reductase [Vibrio sp. 10N.286.49.B3]|uniref:molybdopterin oxidoreductase family protein n=1 Tax=Vibrio sp. 10N.286.49.B3 TaxID=1880855 RepID=UPI000C84F389|nr:nitrate reductase [Vibrio sp. 10N.286.49.B3]
MISNDGWIKTTCAYCGVGCGIEAKPNAQGGLDIRGDKQHPSNYGKLCTKGVALGDTVITDGRLMVPLKRNRINHQSFVTDISWDEATKTVAEKFQQTIQEYGPDSVAFYVSGQLLTEDYYVANKLMKGFIGSSNIDSNSRLCMASSVAGHKRAFGTDTVPICYEDLEQAEMVIITGSNLAWCHPVLFQRLRLAKQNNPQLNIVVIDPRKTATCEISDLHLALKSGSDVSLFNGLLAYLSDNNSLDQQYIEQYTDGFEQALTLAKQSLNLEQNSNVEQITGIASDDLATFYSAFSTTQKVVTIYSQGVNQSSQGTDKVNSILNCHLATGKIGKEGCGPFSITGQPNAMGGREVGGLANTLAAHMEFENPKHHQMISDFWQTNNLADQPGLKAIDLFDAMEQGKIKAVWIMATNPMVSLPDSAKIKSALEKCPFVVVSDCIADTETTQLADMVLPAQGWSEKSGTVTNSERRISRQRRLFPSPGLAKPDWWIVSQVAQKMGFITAFDYAHEGEIFNEYAQLTSLDNAMGENRDLSLIGLTNLDAKGYSELTPQQWPVLIKQTEIVHQRMFHDQQFFTTNKKAQFIAVQHQQPQSQVDTSYPLLLNSGRIRDHWHTMTRTGLSSRLASHTPEPYVTIHPRTAQQYQLQHNAISMIESAQGQVLARVDVNESIAPGELFMPIHWNQLTAKNSKPCDLIKPNADSRSGQPEFKHTPVTIRPWHYRTEAIFISKNSINFESFDYWVKQKVEHGYLYRLASHLNPIELTLQLSHFLDADSDKKLSYESNDDSGNFRVATIKSMRVNRAFLVKTPISELDVEWLEAVCASAIDNEGEQRFMQREYVD